MILKKIFKKDIDIIEKDNIQYYGFWLDFDLNEFYLHKMFVKKNKPLKILGPFYNKCSVKDIIFDFYLAGENRYPCFALAHKQIGFWTKYQDYNNVFRFPCWMWHLDFSQYSKGISYKRFGTLLSIDRLMNPIEVNYSKEQLKQRKDRVIIFSKHLKEPRSTFYELAVDTIGCDGFGQAFGNHDKSMGKTYLLEQYKYSLCPENAIGDGYITEKIPEAFHAGCIPITWCRPSDLELDFNSEAVINLFGLDSYECKEVLNELNGKGKLYQTAISTPLLKKEPILTNIENFILK
jgi:hypothetical protein